MNALLLDCCGVIADIERDGHLVAFNRAFQVMELQDQWSESLYRRLLRTCGGKERLQVYFDEVGWPKNKGQDEFVKQIHRLKTDLLIQIIQSGVLKARDGILQLIDEALGAGVKVAICSAASNKVVNDLLDHVLGVSRCERLEGPFAGDIVSRKKPDPAVYQLASATLHVSPSNCVVIEDSRNGLMAAKGAGMRCVVAPTSYTVGQRFVEADAIYSDLRTLRLKDLFDISSKPSTQFV